jgi:diguanylate cyclase (GGDEF)-like protein
MIDIDLFKSVNDTHGHSGGDAVLKYLASLLKSAFPKSIVGRLGGEEFCILLQQNADTAIRRLELFRKKIECSSIDNNGQEISLTISVGITDCLDETLDNMLVIADTALYQAKERGRNMVVTASQQEDIPECERNTRLRNR